MTLDTLKKSISRLVPSQCQICGSWGHSNSGTKWICDACLAKLFDEKCVSKSSEKSADRAVQISLF